MQYTAPIIKYGFLTPVRGAVYCPAGKTDILITEKGGTISASTKAGQKPIYWHFAQIDSLIARPFWEQYICLPLALGNTHLFFCFGQRPKFIM